MMLTKDQLLSDFLGEIELAEASLLAWGLVDGFLAEQELIERADDFLGRTNAWHLFSDGRSLVDAMSQRRLLFQWGTGDCRFRSRFAETLRLLARLRQLFPKHLRTRGAWQTAPTLVADFRIVLRPRTYPRRDVPATRALGQWTAPDMQGRSLSGVQSEVLANLVGITETAEGFPLAGFQVRATRRILSQTGIGSPSGTMVCAGTGSGKTLAFYLPALTRLAGMIEQDDTAWTRALALYPRTELLKDQFTECCRLARQVNVVLRRHGRRPLRIGTLHGGTPQSSGQVEGEGNDRQGSWRAGAGGRICPFLNCPDPTCGSEMVWRDEDRNQQLERLVCSHCGTAVTEDEIILTRRRISREPPDLLFTTTEMLNRRLSDSWQWHLFGVGVPLARKPVLMLLDEAHTYSGLHGAQVAYLLRRWRHRSGSMPHFVGLSATLMEASAFFANLTGLPQHLVEEVSPESGEMVHEGMEYLVALRGDPVSGTSLLSTTIQAGMLLGRTLDPSGEDISHGVYGSKLFVFTDNLDVTNRLYFNSLDAEGRNARGAPDPRLQPLASLRASNREDRGARFLHGQSWDLCEAIGHSLGGAPLRVGRVSSQDVGVDADADLIVATASLEVGFNDPKVGAVLQHKAPHDAATFLQRKGRAGRRREMRPWLVVVLSDYGRDRIAYGGYDLLFDPELRPRDLPLGNRHLLKMQATYACLDWLAIQIPHALKGQMWRDASGPWRENDSAWRDRARQRQDAAGKVLEDVLAGGDALGRLRDYLKAALRLTSDDVTALLWEPPRAVLTGPLPTLLRRLKHGWLARTEEGAEYHRKNHPLPEFVPESLFSDLNLPEIVVHAVVRRNQSPELFPLPATQALREFAPGRISRRFGIWHQGSRHWISVDPALASPQALDVDAFCGPNDREPLGDFHYRDSGGNVTAIPVVRPFALHVRHDPPTSVADSSNAFLEWRSQILPPNGENPGVAVDLPSRSNWCGLIEEVRFFTHRMHQPARLRRFALGSRAEIRSKDGNSTELTTHFELDDAPVALGFAFETDAVRARVRLPEDSPLQPATLRSLRVDFLRARLTEEARLDGVANTFQRQWLAEIVLAALTANAIALDTPLQEAWEVIRAGKAPISLEAVLEVIFQSVPVFPDAEQEEADQIEQRRHQEIAELLHSETVDEVLASLVPLLWEQPDARWDRWLEERFLATLGGAFHVAIQQLCPDLDAGDLFVDLDGGVPIEETVFKTGTRDLWITESAPGGGGVIERVLPRLAEEPRRFLDLVESALTETDFEVADAELMRLLEWLQSGEHAELTDAVAAVRGALAQQQLANAFTALRVVLRKRGLHTSHPVMAAMSARLLRPGSTEATDGLLQDTMLRWRSEEVRLGVEIEARALAYALSGSDELDNALGGAGGLGVGQDVRQWRFCTLYGMLWPRGTLARNQGLSLYNPFAPIPRPERLLVLDLLDSNEAEIAFGHENWRAQLEASLIQNGRASIVGGPEKLEALRTALLSMLVSPVDTGTLLFYPRARALHRQNNQIKLTLELTAPGQVAPGPPDIAESPSTSRLIVKTMRGSRDEIRDLMESLLVAELLSPGEEIWIVSPWITDLPLLDNRSGTYAGLEPGWPKRHLSLAELLAFALKTSPATRVRVVTRPDPHNRRFCERLRTLAEIDLTGSRLHIERDRVTLHVKGFAGASFAFKGSMNFTFNGIEVLEEVVELETDSRRVSQLLVNFSTHYPLPQ